MIFLKKNLHDKRIRTDEGENSSERIWENDEIKRK